MADLVVPTLGESITEAVIGRWMKKVGDAVAADEPVLELESDKATMQLPAPVAGTMGEQMAGEGQAVKVGEVVGRIEPGDGGKATARPAASAGKAAAAKAPAALQAAGIPAGDAAGEKPAGPAEAAQTRGQSAPTPGPVPPATDAPATAPSVDPAAGGNGEGRRMSPSMRRAQREAMTMPAPPPRDRTVDRMPAAASGARPAPAGSVAAGDREEVVPMSPLRKRIAERLVEAQHSAAALTTFNEVDMSAVMELREAFKQDFADRHGVKLGFMSFFVKACVSALELYPGLNAEVRGESIVYKKRYDLGIAVSTERGLIVPVLRDCERLGFAGVEQGINELAGKARGGKLTIAELQGGTFTITNGGIYGSMMSTPLLNHPQTGILGMHNIVERAVVIDGKVEVRPMMYLALTYDHRVVDGKEAVSFLVAVKQRIERPDRLLLGV